MVYGLFIGEKIIEYSRNLLLRKNGYGGLAYRDAANIGLTHFSVNMNFQPAARSFIIENIAPLRYGQIGKRLAVFHVCRLFNHSVRILLHHNRRLGRGLAGGKRKYSKY